MIDSNLYNSSILSNEIFANSSSGIIKDFDDTLKQIDSDKYSNSSVISSLNGEYNSSTDIHNVGDESICSIHNIAYAALR